MKKLLICAASILGSFALMSQGHVPPSKSGPRGIAPTGGGEGGGVGINTPSTWPNIVPSAAGSSYCTYNGRPGANVPHYQWGLPYVDPSFTPSSGQKLQLPGTGGTMTLNLTAGIHYRYTVRMYSKNLWFDGSGYYYSTSMYRYPGYNEEYPTAHDYACVGIWGYGYPNDGVFFDILIGDTPGSTPPIAGWNWVPYSIWGDFIPPFDGNTSAVYGFDFTPSQSQIGKQYKLAVMSQSAVSQNDRSIGQFESDQSIWTLYINVQSPGAPYLSPNSVAMSTSSGTGTGCQYVAPVPQSATVRVVNGYPPFSLVQMKDSSGTVIDPASQGVSMAFNDRNLLLGWTGAGNAAPPDHEYVVTYKDAQNSQFTLSLDLKNWLRQSPPGCGGTNP